MAKDTESSLNPWVPPIVVKRTPIGLWAGRALAGVLLIVGTVLLGIVWEKVWTAF